MRQAIINTPWNSKTQYRNSTGSVTMEQKQINHFTAWTVCFPFYKIRNVFKQLKFNYNSLQFPKIDQTQNCLNNRQYSLESFAQIPLALQHPTQETMQLEWELVLCSNN